MKRVVKYTILLSCILVSNLAFSQKRNVVVNTESVNRSVIVMDTTANKNGADIWSILEQERIAAEKAEQKRIAAEKAEQKRIAAQKAEQERIADEKAEQERITAEKAEQERIAAEKAEQERIAAEKKEAAKKKYNEYLQNATIKTLIMGEVGYTTTPQLSYGIKFIGR